MHRIDNKYLPYLKDVADRFSKIILPNDRDLTHYKMACHSDKAEQDSFISEYPGEVYYEGYKYFSLVRLKMEDQESAVSELRKIIADIPSEEIQAQLHPSVNGGFIAFLLTNDSATNLLDVEIKELGGINVCIMKTEPDSYPER